MDAALLSTAKISGIFTGRLCTVFAMARKSSQGCHWWVAPKACEGGRWIRTCTASSKDKAIQLLTPRWHDFKSRTWWLLSSPAVSACSYKIAEGSLPKPGNACGAAVSCRKEDTLAFKKRLESLESKQGNRDPTKGNSPRHPPLCRWVWNAIRRNGLGRGAGGRCQGCSAGLCSGLSVLLAKWHFFFSFLSNL